MIRKKKRQISGFLLHSEVTISKWHCEPLKLGGFIYAYVHTSCSPCQKIGDIGLARVHLFVKSSASVVIGAR